MKTSSDTYKTDMDKDGETFFCPLSAFEYRRGVSAIKGDACVEASTVGRSMQGTWISAINGRIAPVAYAKRPFTAANAHGPDALSDYRARPTGGGK